MSKIPKIVNGQKIEGEWNATAVFTCKTENSNSKFELCLDSLNSALCSEKNLGCTTMVWK